MAPRIDALDYLCPVPMNCPWSGHMHCGIAQTIEYDSRICTIPCIQYYRRSRATIQLVGWHLRMAPIGRWGKLAVWTNWKWFGAPASPNQCHCIWIPNWSLDEERSRWHWFARHECHHRLRHPIMHIVLATCKLIKQYQSTKWHSTPLSVCYFASYGRLKQCATIIYIDFS